MILVVKADCIQLSDKEKVCNQVIKRSALMIQAELNLSFCGSGGQIMHGVQMLSLSFNCHRHLTIEEARKLIVNTVEIFKEDMNHKLKIRPYLCNYPFQPGNIMLLIFIQKRNGEEFGPNQLSIVSCVNGTLNYETKISRLGPLKTVHSKSYKEAFKQVEGCLIF